MQAVSREMISAIPRRKALGLAVLILALAVFAVGCSRSPGTRVVTALPPYDLPDGVYTGSADEEIMGKQVAATVELTLADGRITLVEVVDGLSLIAAVDSLIPARIIRYQTPDVEAVTGATASAEIIMKAAKNALIEARKRRVD